DRGKPVRVRGVAVDVYALKDRDPAKDYGTLARDWKANVVRIGVHPGTWKDHKTEALRLLQDHVRIALAKGLFVIVDYHAIGLPGGYYQRSFTGTNHPKHATEAYDSSLAIVNDFWE